MRDPHPVDKARENRAKLDRMRARSLALEAELVNVMATVRQYLSHVGRRDERNLMDALLAAQATLGRPEYQPRRGHPHLDKG